MKWLSNIYSFIGKPIEKKPEQVDPRAGLIVRLRSGGPKMTIMSVDSEYYCVCIWYQGDKYHTDRFQCGVLYCLEG